MLKSKVLKSKMAFVDLVFPLKLGSLTYEAPQSSVALSPGMLVEAELGRTVRRALVLAAARKPETGGLKIKAVRAVFGDGPALSVPEVDLLKWMSGYYMVPEGLVLKVMFGGALFGKDKAKAKTKTVAAPSVPPASPPSADPDMEPGLARLRQMQAKSYRAFLLHAPGTEFESRFVLAASKEFSLFTMERGGGVIVLCPERSRVLEYEELMGPVLGRRLCVLHGGLSPAKRRGVYARILSGEASVVVGTRLAVFAPLPKVSFMAVTSEEDFKNYKNRQDVRYGAREVAVMRAYLEKAPVLLSSICPSAESRVNAMRGKYEYLDFRGVKTKPEVKVKVKIVPDTKKDGAGAGVIDGALAGMLARTLDRGGSALLLANRQGHSVPLCEDCGHFERCPECGSALVLHKSSGKLIGIGGTGSLVCHHCGSQRAAFEACPVCGGLGLKLLGAGTERLREEAEGFLKNLIFKGRAKDTGIKILGPGAKAGPEGQSAAIYIGTKAKTKSIASTGPPSLAALIHPESAFFRPDFRARERVFAELAHLADALSPGGQIIIRTRTPRIFGPMKGLDYEAFIMDELEERKALGYPPFSRLARITVLRQKAKEKNKNLNAGAEEASPGPIGVDDSPDASVLGPAEGRDERGKKFLSYLVKAPTARALKKAVEKVLESLSSGLRPGKVIIDIDPV